MQFYSLKNQHDALFKNMSKIPAFKLRPLKAVINFDVDILSLQKLEYEAECVDLPDDYNCFEIVYCVHLAFPYAHIQLKQANNSILSNFQEEDHPFIHDTLNNKKTQSVCLYFVYRPKKTHPERIYLMITKKLMHLL